MATIDNITPTPGVQPGDAGGFPLHPDNARLTPIEFDVYSELELNITVTTAAGTSLVRGGGAFLGEWRARSARTSIVGGYHYRILPEDGWSDGGVTALDVTEILPEATTMSAADFERILATAKRLFLPAGDYTLDRTVVLPSDCTVTGVGKGTRILVAGDFPAFESDTSDDKPENSTISFLCIRHTNTLDPEEATPQFESDGIRLWGDNHSVMHVRLENCFVPIMTIEQAAGDEENYSTDLLLQSVRCMHENPTELTAQYGCLLYSLKGFDILACEWLHAWLDGIKLIKNCSDGKILGGRSSYNGQVRLLTDTGAGDGLDGFGGARNILIEGLTCEGNGGSAVIFKTIGIQGVTDFRPYGPCENITIRGCFFRDNFGIGVALDTILDSTSTHNSGPKLATTDEDDRPRLRNVKVEGNVIERCGLSGLFVNALWVTSTDNTIEGCGVDGIIVEENARDYVSKGDAVRGCSTDSAGARPAVTVWGAKRVTFSGLTINGKEVEPFVGDAALAALTDMHRSNIEILYPSDEVTINQDCTGGVTTTGGDFDAVAVVITSASWSTEQIVIHHRTTQATGNSRFSGSPGSTVTCSTGAANIGEMVWTKTTGDPDELVGWAPTRVATDVQTLANNSGVSTNMRLTLYNVASARANTISVGSWEGHPKEIECTVAGATGVITGAFIRGATAYTTITFSAVGQYVRLEYHATGGWRILEVHADTATGLTFPVFA